MNEDFRNDVLTMREYLFNAVKAADQLKAVSEGAPMSSASMQQTLERRPGSLSMRYWSCGKSANAIAPASAGTPNRA